MSSETTSVEAAGKRLGISRPLAYRMVHTGKLPALRFGRVLKIPTAIIDRMLGIDNGSKVE